jgi:penicillin-binding protein 1C
VRKHLTNIASLVQHLSLKRKVLSLFVIFAAVIFFFSLPSKLFNSPTSFVLEDADGNLLSATIAADGQWRFPYDEDVPAKFITCITTFEDKRFFYHPGVDPVAMTRAVWQNIRGKKVVSGGSTLTMQVIRLSRKKNRTIWQKMIEMVLAVRAECAFSKKEIVALYASNAPFGSNVVGLDAAAWRYYGRSADKLSWGEMAALAVLPNSPSLVHPGKNANELLRKRNELLQKLIVTNAIDKTTGELALLEPLPGEPKGLPQFAPHLLDRFRRDYAGLKKQDDETSSRVQTTIQLNLQTQVTQLVGRYHQGFRGNGINNAAAMVMEVESGNIVAYVGNVYNPADRELESHVDVLNAPRSPGSTLKPLLFAALQTDGAVLPRQLIPDVPTQIGGYTPQNFNMEYDGAVPASRAISRSLNIPAVKMLQQYKYPRFYDLLRQCGFTTINKPADHYGLSLILGGCEVTPYELAGVYSSMARSYLHQQKNKGKMLRDDWFMPCYQIKNKGSKVKSSLPINQSTNQPISLDYTSLWHTFNAMQEVMRPGEEGIWNVFNSAQRIAWKTGTSFGFRDGWAVGLTPKYCVVVWVGNTDGEGRPELTGINTAAPLMFDIFRLLPTSNWFQPPQYDFMYMPVCHQSGFKAGINCTAVDTVMVSNKSANAGVCPYHRIIHVDNSGSYRVTENCMSPSAMLHKSWFLLPPAMEYYYKAKHQDYQPLPPFMAGCNSENNRSLDIIYPEESAKIYVPKEVSGEKGKTVFTAAHRNEHAKLFWHIDDQYAGTTQQFHQMGFNPAKGLHTLTIVDEKGETSSRRFEILEKD